MEGDSGRRYFLNYPTVATEKSTDRSDDQPTVESINFYSTLTFNSYIIMYNFTRV